MDLSSLPHHDGSALYLSPAVPRLGGTVTVRVRVPHGTDVRAISVRTTPDHEPLPLIPAGVVADGPDGVWWEAAVPVRNPVVRYRFLVESDDDRWLNSTGLWAHDVPDSADFVVTTHEPAPSWLPGAVGYQIFPDRFARGPERPAPPGWAVAADWDDPVVDDPSAVFQWYGGDLAGIEARLDHLERLGVNLLYLTPVFPARSSHRYDASTFTSVDPLLGGDAAFASLLAAAHSRGMKVIGDITLNHTGDHHEWFVTAQKDAAAPEAGFYIFDEHPSAYRAWFDVPSLPKLDHRSEELRRRLITDADSVIASWLRPPYSLDGWRVDCANVTARIDDVDLNLEVARDTRAAMRDVAPDTWLLAEHCTDATEDLLGDGWHGTMAYHWFSGPLWSWLAGSASAAVMGNAPLVVRSGDRMVRSMRALVAGVPWAARAASMTMLDSHDVARCRTIVGGDAARHVAAMAMLFTSPGVPTLFAGSEIGLEGAGQNSARVPFPWDEDQWDRPFFEAVSELVRLRRASTALSTGGMRWVQASADAVTFLRESPGERVLVHVARDAHEPITFDSIVVGAAGGDVLFGGRQLEWASAGRPIELPHDGAGAWIWRLS